MKPTTLKNQILTSFLAVILVLSVLIFALGHWVINKDIIERAQSQVDNYLDGARSVYDAEIERIGNAMSLVSYDQDLEKLRIKMNLDYLFKVQPEDAGNHPSRIVCKVFSEQVPAGGTRIVGRDEIDKMSPEVKKRTQIEIIYTQKALPTQKKTLDTAMAKEYALPIFNTFGQLQEIVYGGRIINRDYSLVDRIRDLVFGNEKYNGKPVGTVTIFQDDTRISTNVLDEQGKRAIGTRVSEEVYQRVVVQKRRWQDRAFVVTHWYKTAYEPIWDIDGNIIGILYVGILEDPFNNLSARILLLFLAVILLASVLAGILGFVLAGSISRPITHLMKASGQIAGGKLGTKVYPETPIKELTQFAESFNEMSQRLSERESSLKISNEKLAESNEMLEVSNQKLEELNKSYLDLLGFVAHELKGLLASATINAYSIRDGFLGMINFKQKRAVDSICRNLDYLDATVKKFLNLSRIERDNLEINRTEFSLRKDVFDTSVQTFAKLISDKKMKVDNRIDPTLKVNADQDLLLIVANNLINNAAKYGSEGGRIEISAAAVNAQIRIDVYNDSRPITEADRQRLFKKFSRLDNPEKKKVKGTGLGLYITKQIVEAHGGQINVEPRQHGNSFIFTIERG